MITTCFAYVIALAVGDALFTGFRHGRTIKIGDRCSLVYAMLDVLGIGASVCLGLGAPGVFGWLRFSVIVFVYLLLGVHYHMILARSNVELLITRTLVRQRYASAAALIASAMLLAYI